MTFKHDEMGGIPGVNSKMHDRTAPVITRDMLTAGVRALYTCERDWGHFGLGAPEQRVEPRLLCTAIYAAMKGAEK